MNLRRIGFWTAFIFMLISVGQVHEMIPGLKYLKLGTITTTILYILVIVELRNMKWSSVVIWRLLFFLAMLPGLIFGFNRGAIFIGVKNEASLVLAFFLGGILFFRTMNDLRKIQSAFIVLAAALSLWAITHSGRGPGLLGDENDVALVMVMLLPFPFFKLLEKLSLRGFVIYLLIFFCTLAGIASTLSRGGMVGTLVVLAACWLKSRYKISTIVVLFLLVAVVVVFGPNNESSRKGVSLVSEFQTISDTHETTADERLFYWGLSWKMFEARPIFGVGARAWGDAAWSGLVNTGGRKFSNMTPHSIYFQLISELGLAGIIPWLGIVLSCFFGFRYLLPENLNRQMGVELLHNTDPLFVKQLEDRRKFFSNFGLALGIGLLGFLASGAFLSVLFYAVFTTFVCVLQAARDTWDRELQILKFANARKQAIPVTAEPSG